MSRPLFAITLAAVAACADGRAESGGVVDSIVSIDTALARFQAGLDMPSGLEHGARSLDGLLATFLARLQQNDTAGLNALALTREEFAYLYYPALPEARPPYELSPGLLWFMIETGSARGLNTLLAERGGQQLGTGGYRCPTNPREEGQNTVWPVCLVSTRDSAGRVTEERLFGPIVRRGPMFKFVTFANKL